MNYKKVLVVALVVVLVLVVGNYSIKRFLFPYKYEEYVNKYSEIYDVDPLLVLSVMKGESNFDPNAQSNKSAKGLMQIMDSTGEWIAEELGIKNFNTDMLYDAETSIMFGCWYLNNLEKEFGKLQLVLAAYNGGSGHVTQWLSDERYSKDGETLYYIPFKETKKYVDKVQTNYSIYKHYYEK